MKSLLVTTFVKDYKNTDNPKVRKAYTFLSSTVGIIANSIIAISKIVFGILFFSISIIADGINNLSDAGSSVISLIGCKIALKPADKEHPFGHARVEYVVGMIISFIILFIGMQLLISSIEGIFSPKQMQFSFITLGILIASIIVKLWLSVFNRRIAKAINSTAIKGVAVDSLCDVIATIAVTASLLLFYFFNIAIDSYMGVLVSLFIGFSGIKLLKETLNPLLGEKPNSELVNKIYTRIKSYPLVMGIHDLVVHNYGHHKNFVSAHVEMDYKNDILECHEQIDKIERDFFDDNINIVIHLDPIVTDDEKTNQLRKKTIDILQEIDPHLTMHDFRVVWGKLRKNVIFDIVVPHSYYIKDDELVDMVEKKFHELDGSLFVVISIDKN